MKQYFSPEMELVKFQVEDVLASSAVFNPDSTEGNDWNAGQGDEGIPLGF